MSEEIKNIDTETAAPVAEAAEPAADTAAAPAPAAAAPAYARRPYGSQEEGGDRPYQRNMRFKRKVCRFCHDKNATIDYKDLKMVEQFITDRGKILPRRVTGTCAKHQRGVAQAIKRARIIALIPFVEK
jgi:small subunit ribosomal protein S18